MHTSICANDDKLQPLPASGLPSAVRCGVVEGRSTAGSRDGGRCRAHGGHSRHGSRTRAMP